MESQHASDRGFPPSLARRGALQIYESLRDDILWLRLKPGSVLDERALAKRFSVSRTPVREALLLLSGEYFVQFLPNRTSIVAPFSLDNTGAYLDSLLLLSRASARSAALSGRASAVSMEGFICAYADAAATGDFEAVLKSDHGLQRYLSSLSENIFQDRFISQILDAGVRMQMLHYFPNARSVELSEAIRIRKRLTKAVLEGDPDRSDQIITDMICAVIAIVGRSLEPQVGMDMDVGSLAAG